MTSRFIALSFRLVVVVVSLFLLLSCHKEEKGGYEIQPQSGTTNGRTVIVYMAAENSLSAYVSADVREMLRGTKYLGSNDHLLLFVDNGGSARIYDVTWRDTVKTMSELSPAYRFPKSVNSCDVQTLKLVLDYAHTHCTAPSYYLFMWSHGSGWLPEWHKNQASAPRFAFGYDNEMGGSTDTGPQMDITDIAKACSGLDLIFFDACFMQNIETAYQLRHSARIVAGSPSEIPADGAPYDLIMQPLFSDGDNIADILNSYQQGYGGDCVLLTAIRTEQLNHFAQYMAGLVARYREQFLAVNTEGLLNYFNYDVYRKSGPFADFCDIRGLMKRVLSPDDYTTWCGEYDKIIAASVVSNSWVSVFARFGERCTVDKSQYGGSTMHVPLEKYDEYSPWFSQYFFTLDWGRDVWGEPDTSVN